MIAAGQTPISPITESSTFRMLEWLKANVEPEPQRSEPSQAQRNADAELQRVIAIYNDLSNRVLHEQKACKHPGVQQRAAALGMSISADLMARPAVVTVTGRELAPVAEARAATAKVGALVYDAQDRLAKLEAFSKLQNVDIDTIIFAIGSRLSAVEGQVEFLERQLETLTTKQQRKARS
jgi:hypothetical protein